MNKELENKIKASQLTTGCLDRLNEIKRLVEDSEYLVAYIELIRCRLEYLKREIDKNIERIIEENG